MAQATTDAERIGERAGAWYERNIRQHVETHENLGKHLVINPETGDYLMGNDPAGDDDLEVSHAAIARFGTSHLFGLRVGYPASEAIGTTLEPFPHLRGADSKTGTQ